MQQGLDTHIATSPDTVMILNQDGQLTTHGPSRTEIRQDNTDNKTRQAWCFANSQSLTQEEEVMITSNAPTRDRRTVHRCGFSA